MAKLKIGQKLKRLVGIVAPTIGTAALGPLGGVAGKFLQDALGVDSEDAAVALLESDPEAIGKAKAADQAFRQHLADNEIELEKINAEDRASARARQIATKDNMPAVVFLVTSLGFFGTLGALFLWGLPESGGEVILAMVGSLGAAWGASVAYFVGSSAGSSRKTDIMANSGPRP
jgi:hypothetical protein